MTTTFNSRASAQPHPDQTTSRITHGSASWRSLWETVDLSAQLAVSWTPVTSGWMSDAAVAPEADSCVLLNPHADNKAILIYFDVPDELIEVVLTADRVSTLIMGPLKPFFAGPLGEIDLDLIDVDDEYWFACDCGLIYQHSNRRIWSPKGYVPADDATACPRCGETCTSIELTRCPDCFELVDIHRCDHHCRRWFAGIANDSTTPTPTGRQISASHITASHINA